MRASKTKEIKDLTQPASLPPASLIICSRNRPILLQEMVRSILQDHTVPAELIIVDQSDAPCSNLSSFTVNAACKLRYLWTPPRGVSWARNLGIAEAQYDIVALTDDDMLATPTWFSSLIRALIEASPNSVVTGQVLPIKAEMAGRFVPSTKVDEEMAVYEGRVGKDVLYTGNMAMFSSTMQKVGGFDEHLGPGTSFPAAEDNDLGFRLLEAGYRILYVPEARLYHRGWRSEGDYLLLRWRYGRGQGAYYAKHLSLRDRYMLKRVGADIAYYIYRGVSRLRRHRRLAQGDAVYLIGVLSGAVKWWLTQRRPGRTRAMAPGEADYRYGG